MKLLSNCAVIVRLPLLFSLFSVHTEEKKGVGLMSAANTTVVRRLILERDESRPLAQCRSPDGGKRNLGTQFPGFHPRYVQPNH